MNIQQQRDGSINLVRFPWENWDKVCLLEKTFIKLLRALRWLGLILEHVHKSLLLARILLSQLSQNLPPSRADHLLVPLHPQVTSGHPGLPQDFCKSVQQNNPNLLVTVPPSTPNPLFLSYKFPLFLTLFRVKPNLSPLLQSPIVVIPILIKINSNKVCLPILASIMNSFFFNNSH